MYKGGNQASCVRMSSVMMTTSVMIKIRAGIISHNLGNRSHYTNSRTNMRSRNLSIDLKKRCRLSDWGDQVYSQLFFELCQGISWYPDAPA